MLAPAERQSLCDSLERWGASAPTLCEGWSGLEMAAHVYVRERDPFAGLGIVLPGPFAAMTARRMEAAKTLGFATLVARVRKPPPLHWRLVPDAIQFIEFLIHNEDVRRANGEGPRVVAGDVSDSVWRWLGGAGRLYARDVRCGIELHTPDGRSRLIVTGDPTATITGEPVELLLYLAGRSAAAEVSIDGPDAALSCLRAADFSI